MKPSEKLIFGAGAAMVGDVLPFSVVPTTQEELAAPPPTMAAQQAARDAYERGDFLFQCSIVLAGRSGKATLGGAFFQQETADANSALNDICTVGWDLVSSSVVFIPTEHDTRKKILGGQELAISGLTVGYYVWQRRYGSRH